MNFIKTKGKVAQMIFFVCAMTILVSVYTFWMHHIIREKSIYNSITFSKDILFDFQNSIGKDGEMDGWILWLGIFDVSVDEILLQPIDSTEEVFLSVKQFQESGLNEQYMNYYPYAAKEFTSRLNSKKIDEDKCYEIFLLLRGVRGETFFGKLTTKKYLYKGKIFDYNPIIFSEPYIGEDVIDSAIKFGRLCAYDMEHGIFAYVYEKSIYWIVKKDSSLLSDNGKTEMPYHIFTFSNDELPEGRKEHGYDNRDFYFEDKEYLVNENSDYRVAVVDIPEDYIPTYISSGVYSNALGNWVWNCKFLIYENDKVEKGD